MLTRHLGEVIELGPGDRVLDVARGRGASAVHLAERFDCHVTGLDYGPENVAAAEAHAAECGFCTFPDKATAAAEMARVLRPGGWLGLTDMTVDGPLPDDIQSLLAWVACVAGAGTPEDYVATLRGAGLTGFVVEDQRDALLDMVADVRCKLLGVELAAGLGKLDLGDPACRYRILLGEKQQVLSRTAFTIKDRNSTLRRRGARSQGFYPVIPCGLSSLTPFKARMESRKSAP